MSTAISIPIYSSDIALLPVSGNTPFGYYDTDAAFQQDAQKFVVFATRRLGYPIMEIQLQDINFYAAYEDAVTVYGKELYEYKIRENYISFEGNTTGSSLNNTLIKPSMGNIIRMAQEYGNEVGSGGNINYYTGSLAMTAGNQNYDLNLWASQSGVVQDGDSIEIKRIYYEAPPAITRYFDPYAGTGTGLQSLMDTFGFGQFSPGINFMLMPIYFDVLKIQAIEFNDQIRKSAYSFELMNNKLRILPIPSFNRNLYFTYIKKSERNSVIAKDIYGNPVMGTITDTSKVPYTVPTYSYINSVFRKWINDYALAIIKETLGNVRNTYTSIPIPGAEVVMNGASLVEQGKGEQLALIEQLRATMDDTSRQKQLEKKKMDNDNMRDTLGGFPMPIYIL
jgi:hypothetical protein